MSAVLSARYILRIWLAPLTFVAVVFVCLILLGTGVDRLLTVNGVRDNELYRLLLPAHGEVADLIGNANQLLVAIAGIAITVASILVQLSATRYSSRVMDLFIEDRINLSIFTLYIVTPLYGLWMSFLGTALPQPSTHVLFFKLLAGSSLLALLPYFNYLFHFLRPENIIQRIQNSVQFDSLSTLASVSQLEKLRANLISSVTQLSDVVLNSILNSDMNLALLSIDRLRALSSDYLEVKHLAPDQWFLVPRRAFLGLEEAKLQRLGTERTWVEMHCLKQYELIFVRSLNEFREVSAAIGHRTRDVGMAAIHLHDRSTVLLVVLFFNTYLRHAINAGDIRTMFHTFYQYRRLAEGLLHPEWRDLLRRIANHFKYYGQESERRGAAFAMEIAAYDLRMLVERAFVIYPASAEDLLEVFLEVDRKPDSSEAEQSQRGVRKNQAILASFFLFHGEQALARSIYEDMKHEQRDRMRSIYEELLLVTSEDYWEIQDRGSNFYFVPPAQHQALANFFSWFDESA